MKQIHKPEELISGKWYLEYCGNIEAGPIGKAMSCFKISWENSIFDDPDMRGPNGYEDYEKCKFDYLWRLNRMKDFSIVESQEQDVRHIEKKVVRSVMTDFENIYWELAEDEVLKQFAGAV